MLNQDLQKTLILNQAELDSRQAQLIKLQAEIEILKQESDQQRIVIWDKLPKLKQVWRERGTLALFKFVYQKIRKKQQSNISYQNWLEKHQLKDGDIAKARRQISQMKLRPKFSVIMPVYNVEAKWLEKAIESVRKQIYPDWELCIADDASTKPHIRPLLEKYSKLDSRIKVFFREENGHISAASNSALELATGDYIALLDNDDEFTIDALYENAKLINSHPEADFIYSDEDKIDSKGNLSGPFFKPDWSPEYFHACMYTCHLGVYRAELIREIGGFRKGYDGAQDYDLVLRVVEETKNIFHIPKILYHWRIIPSSAASGSEAKPWAYKAAQKSLEAMIERSPYPGWVDEGPSLGFFRVRRKIVGHPLVSIVIPTGGKSIETSQGSLHLLENCLASINKLSTYKNFEVIVVDSDNLTEANIQTITAPNLNIIQCLGPFNLSKKINQGADAAQGEFLLLLNDDIEVITPDWLESMVELAQQKEIGAVGAKLLFPNDTIQHSGVAIIGGNPGHTFYGVDKNHPGYFLSNIVNRNYFAVTGACVMMRRDLFQQLGGFDEELPLNYNDVDLCLKAHQAGYRNVLTPYAQLIHYESVSRDKGVQPGEWQKLNQKWGKYFKITGGNPYYNPNLSPDAQFSLF